MRKVIAILILALAASIPAGAQSFGQAWFYGGASGVGGGVTSVNTLTGAVVLAAGTNITLTPSGNTITVASTAGGTTTNQVAKGISANTSGTSTAVDTIVCTPPATVGTFMVDYINPTAAATAPACTQVGLPASTISGAATTYTVLASDAAAGLIVHDKAASGTVAVTLPTPTTLANTNAVFVYTNHSAQTDTITPTTWTIQSNIAAAGATLSVGPGVSTRISVDPFNATNWIADTINTAGGSTAFSAITSATNTTAAMVVGTGASLALTGTATLNLSADTAAAAFKVPVGAGFTASANGVVNYDSTAGNTHVGTNGADSLAAAEAAAVVTNTITKATDSTHALLTASSMVDNGTSVTSTDTGGYVAPVFVSNGTTAGFVDYPQGTTSAAVAPCNVATSVCVQAPTAVTSYLVNLPGASATGITTNNVASAVDTQGFSGDANHSATVTIGSGTSVGSTSLCSTGNCPVGTYVIHAYLDITTACGTTGTYVVNLIYTDDQGSKTIPINFNGTGAVPATGVVTTTSTANFGENSQVLRSTGAASINYSTTAVACGTAGPMVGKLYLAAIPVM
jgi:hypothetical protein